MKTRRTFLTEAGAVLSGLSIPAVSHAWGWRRRAAPCPPVACRTFDGTMQMAVPVFNYGNQDGLYLYECAACNTIPSAAEDFMCLCACLINVSDDPKNVTCVANDPCQSTDTAIVVSGSPALTCSLRTSTSEPRFLPAKYLRANGHGKNIKKTSTFAPYMHTNSAVDATGTPDGYLVYADPFKAGVHPIYAKVWVLTRPNGLGPLRLGLELDQGEANDLPIGQVMLGVPDPTNPGEARYHRVIRQDQQLVHVLAKN